MPTLTKLGEVISDHWFVAAEPQDDTKEGALVPAERWQQKVNPGLYLQVDAEPEAVHSSAEVIGIEFPAFNDGRGLSLAVLLRERLGFTGDLRAFGDVHPDMLHYLQRSGFTSFELPQDRDLATAQAAMQPYTAYYQGSVAEPTPVFRRP